MSEQPPSSTKPVTPPPAAAVPPTPTTSPPTLGTSTPSKPAVAAAKPASAPVQAKPASPTVQTMRSTVEGEGWKARPIRLKIFGNLIAEVVHKGIFMYCGACIASCPIDILFHSENEEPIMRGTCAACQVCYYSCPRIELPVAEIERRIFGRERTAEETILGIHIGSYSIRAKDQDILKRAQDGGAVSALMLYALENKIIDYALVSGCTSQDPWKPGPRVARTRQELLDNAGSQYSPGGQVGG